MRIFSVFVFFSFCLCQSVFGAALTQLNPNCACDPQMKDPLEEARSFAFGKFNGECVDSCRFRRARILESGKGEILVGNILHHGKFYIARIPVDKIQSAEIVFEEFAPMIAHVFLRFHFSGAAPLQLSDQVTREKLTPVHSLILSAEGVPAKNHKYNLFESYFGHYLLATRIATDEDMEDWTTRHHHTVIAFPLRLSAEQASQLFMYAVQESEKTSFQSVYELFSNNCSTTALSEIEFVKASSSLSVKSKIGVWDRFESALSLVGPLSSWIGTLNVLRARGFVSLTR